ncbi:MAG: carboxypeptidase-like regulatory domain-containing protein, partial [Acidobacteriota bacterium]
MTRSVSFRFLICLTVAVALAPAQETRSMIYGRVLDPSKAPVAGATVSVTHTETNSVHTLKTNETGYYEANFLLPGQYAVAVEMAGFKKAIQTGILLPIATRQEIGITLEIGAVSDSVSVTADAPLLETNAVSSGRVIDNR